MGRPGSKSFYARVFCKQEQLSYFLKPLNKWWDRFEDVVIIEDVDRYGASDQPQSEDLG